MEALCVFRGLSCATAWTPQWRCDSRAFRHAEETQFAPLTWHNLSMCGLECVEDTWWNSRCWRYWWFLSAPRATRHSQQQSSVEAPRFKEKPFLMTFSKRCVFPASLFHHSFQKERRQRRSHRAHRERHRSLDQNRWRLEVLLRLQLRLFGPEGESNILFCWGGERKVEGQRTLLPRGRGRTWKDGLDQGRAGGVQGLQTASLPEGWRPADSSPRLCLYLWVTWLLRRPGNVCSVSVLNEPPSRDRQSYIPHTVATDSLIHGGGLCPDSSTR